MLLFFLKLESFVVYKKLPDSEIVREKEREREWTCERKNEMGEKSWIWMLNTSAFKTLENDSFFFFLFFVRFQFKLTLTHQASQRNSMLELSNMLRSWEMCMVYRNFWNCIRFEMRYALRFYICVIVTDFSSILYFFHLFSLPFSSSVVRCIFVSSYVSTVFSCVRVFLFLFVLFVIETGNCFFCAVILILCLCLS